MNACPLCIDGVKHSAADHVATVPAGIAAIFAGEPNTGFRACPVCRGVMIPDSLDPEDELVFTDDGDLVHARCEQPAPSQRRVT